MRPPTNYQKSGSSLMVLGLLALMASPFLLEVWNKFRTIYYTKSAEILGYPLGKISPTWRQVLKNKPQEPPLPLAKYLAAQAARVWLWVIIPLEVIWGLYVAVTNKEKTFRRKITMWDLVKINAAYRPCMRPIVKSGPIDEKSNTQGPWRLADTPLGYVLEARALEDRLYNMGPAEIIEPSDILDPETGLPKANRRELINPFINIDVLRASFTNQLGPGARDLKNSLLNPVRELAMALWCQIIGRKDLTEKIFDELNTNWNPKTHLTFAPSARKVWDDFQPHEMPKNLKKHQGFQNSFMMALLAAARTKGLIPTSLFIWLRPTNRPLFYSLNQMGSQIAWTESIGPWCHYLTEEFKERALFDPAVDLAIKSLWDVLYKEQWLKEPWPYEKPKAESEHEAIFKSPENPSQPSQPNRSQPSQEEDRDFSPSPSEANLNHPQPEDELEKTDLQASGHSDRKANLNSRDSSELAPNPQNEDPTDPKAATTLEASDTTFESATAEPVTVEPITVESATVQEGQLKADSKRLSSAESITAEPVTAEPATVQEGQVKADSMRLSSAVEDLEPQDLDPKELAPQERDHKDIGTQDLGSQDLGSQDLERQEEARQEEKHQPHAQPGRVPDMSVWLGRNSLVIARSPLENITLNPLPPKPLANLSLEEQQMEENQMDDEPREENQAVKKEKNPPGKPRKKPPKNPKKPKDNP